jgi:hypothetical protein
MDPEIGIAYITGTILASNLTAALTAKMKRGEKPVEWEKVV